MRNWVLIIIAIHLTSCNTKFERVDVLKYEKELLSIKDSLMVNGETYFCIENQKQKSLSKKNIKEIKAKLNRFHIDCIYISFKDSTIQFTSKDFIKTITYLYDFSVAGDKIIEYDEPKSSSYLKKIGYRWYYQETGFD